MLLQGLGAIYGTTLTNTQLFGTGGTYLTPASDGIYTVSSSNANHVDLRAITNTNPYPNDGLINYGWKYEPNKYSPGYLVFSSESFGDELDDLLTN